MSYTIDLEKEYHKAVKNGNLRLFRNVVLGHQKLGNDVSKVIKLMEPKKIKKVSSVKMKSVGFLHHSAALDSNCDGCQTKIKVGAVDGGVLGVSKSGVPKEINLFDIVTMEEMKSYLDDKDLYTVYEQVTDTKPDKRKSDETLMSELLEAIKELS